MNNLSESQRQSGVSPFVPEYQDYISSYPGRGTLKVQISAAYETFPVNGVEVDVSVIHNGVRYLLYSDITNSSGIVDNMVLPTRAVDTVLDRIETILPLSLTPVNHMTEGN